MGYDHLVGYTLGYDAEAVVAGYASSPSARDGGTIYGTLQQSAAGADAAFLGRGSYDASGTSA